MKITTHSSQLSQFPQTVSSSSPQPQVNEANPMQTVLFGKALPRLLHEEDFLALEEILQFLRRQKDKLAIFAGDMPEDYRIALAEGEVACIDAQGVIMMGVALLALGRSYHDLLLGILAHEIGHRPKTWVKLHIDNPNDKKAIAHLAREEEAKADRFAGRALAELTISPEALCRYLQMRGSFEAHEASMPLSKDPSQAEEESHYYPVEVRIQMIKAAYASEKVRIDTAKRHFPAFYQATNVKNLIHDGYLEDIRPRPKQGPKGRR